MTTPLGRFVEALFQDLFYQPDDAVFQAALDTRVSTDCRISVNGRVVPTEAYKAMIAGLRQSSTITLKTSSELLANPAPEGGDLSTVGHRQTFTTTNKETGDAKEQTSLTICTIATSPEGKQQLVDLAEIIV